MRKSHSFSKDLNRSQWWFELQVRGWTNRDDRLLQSLGSIKPGHKTPTVKGEPVWGWKVGRWPRSGCQVWKWGCKLSLRRQAHPLFRE